MFRKKLKWAIMPVVAIATIAGLSAFTGGGEDINSGPVVRVVRQLTCYGDQTEKVTGYGNDCTSGAGNCVANYCPEGTHDQFDHARH